MENVKAFYVWDENLINRCDELPAVKGRASMVHDLIESYGLLDHIKVLKSTSASYKDLREFHSELYLDHLQNIKDIDDDYSASTQDEEHGIGYDCPPVTDMFNLVSIIAGGSLTAAQCLVMGMANVVINWTGGWHHAHRFGAEGFCYVNDIVLAIEKLRLKFSKVLYIDLDVHHGNGVQDAYSLSKSVFTLSIHKFEVGFYPGTGAIDDIGTQTGKGYTCNVPLHEGYCDETFIHVFENVFPAIYESFKPDAIVVQCGADALALDPHGGARLTQRSYCTCVQAVLDKRKPTLLLGGGGYHHANTARLWASITALVAGVKLNEDIPDHDQWTNYGPDYTINISPALAKDANNKAYLDECIDIIKDSLKTHLNNINGTKRNASLLTESGEEYQCMLIENSKILKKTFPENKLPKLNEKPNNRDKDESEDVYDFTE